MVSLTNPRCCLQCALSTTEGEGFNVPDTAHGDTEQSTNGEEGGEILCERGSERQTSTTEQIDDQGPFTSVSIAHETEDDGAW